MVSKGWKNNRSPAEVTKMKLHRALVLVGVCALPAFGLFIQFPRIAAAGAPLPIPAASPSQILEESPPTGSAYPLQPIAAPQSSYNSGGCGCSGATGCGRPCCAQPRSCGCACRPVKPACGCNSCCCGVFHHKVFRHIADFILGYGGNCGCGCQNAAQLPYGQAPDCGCQGMSPFAMHSQVQADMVSAERRPSRPAPQRSARTVSASAADER